MIKIYKIDIQSLSLQLHTKKQKKFAIHLLSGGSGAESSGGEGAERLGGGGHHNAGPAHEGDGEWDVAEAPHLPAGPDRGRSAVGCNTGGCQGCMVLYGGTVLYRVCWVRLLGVTLANIRTQTHAHGHTHAHNTHPHTYAYS